MENFKKILDSISIKGRLYVEAVLMITEGEDEIRRGTEKRERGFTELAHLDGKSGKPGRRDERATAGGRRVDVSSLVSRPSKAPAKKTVAARTALRPVRRDRPKRSDAEIRRDVERLLARDPHMTANQVTRGVGGNYERTHKIVKTLMPRKPTKQPKAGKSRADQQRSAKPADPAQDAADAEKILELLKAGPTPKAVLMEKLDRTYYPITRVLAKLAAEGKVVVGGRACRLA